MLKDNLLPIKAGCIDLTTLEVRKRTKEDMFNFYLDVELVDNTDKAEQFIKQVCPADDDDAYKYLLDCLSYFITPWNFLKKYFCWWGPDGNNGKTVLINVIESILGNLYTSVQEDLFTQKKRQANAATNDINQCIGKFVGSYNETTKAVLGETTIKMITGDDTISYRRNYQAADKVKLYMKLVLIGNDKPNWSHNSPMAARMAFFPFENKFVDKVTKAHHHKTDVKKVRAMMTGAGRNQMFSLLVRNAASLYKRRKLHKSAFVDRAFKQYICEVDTTTQFITTAVQKKAGGGMTIGQIFDKYKQWCNDNNSYCEKKGVFSGKFKKAIPPRATLLHGNTVYDVEMVGQKTNVMVTPDTLDDYWRKENKSLLNEMDEVTEERDMLTTERDETEKLHYDAMEMIERQQQEILKLQQQMQKFYRQGTGEKELQKSVYANLAKHAQGMKKMESARRRFPFA